MQWFFMALIGNLLWALTNISDQYLVKKYSTSERGSGGLVLFSSLIGIFVAIIIGVFTSGVFDILTLDKMLLMLTGGLIIAWTIFYFFALELEDVSAVVTLFLTIPVFGYILGYVFLNETLTNTQLLGSGIVLLGSLLVSIDFREQKIKIKWKPALYMLLACLIIAISGIIFKYVTIGGNFWVSSFWQYVGLGISGLLIYLFVPKYRNEFINMNKVGGRKIFTLNTLSETLTVMGNLLTSYAILLVPVTLVYIVGSFQPAILLVLTLVLTQLFPNIVKEDMSSRVLFPKIVALIIMISGSILFLV